MRFIYIILLGLVMFNASLLLFADVFDYASTSGADEDAINTSELYEGTYGDPNNLWEGVIYGLLNIYTAAIIGVMLAAGGLFNKFTGGTYSLTLIIGISFFIGIIMSLWVSTFNVVTNLTGEYGYMLNGLITIISIAIGLIIVFSINEMFLGQQGAN